ncbi:MAG: TIR domain-containing protein, partial [Anaerolineae bacterium]|nr:TIR domain-containing protein [Anaerolineae bacterium]
MSHIFISYARADGAIVDQLREDLLRERLPYWIDRIGLPPGTPNWERAIRKAIEECTSVLWGVSPASFVSPYVRDEVAIARMLERKIYPVWADGEHWLACVPLGYGQIQYADLRGERYATGFAQLLAALRVPDSDVVMPVLSESQLSVPAEPRNPYKGLLAFTEADAGDFFGREALTDRICQRLSQQSANSNARFLAVLGPSGSGKSSAVMAGLIPALKQGRVEGSSQWVYLPPVVPGTHPLSALTEALYRGLPEKSLSDIEADLRSPDGRALHRLGTLMAGERVLLYIDQFEELFTLTEDAEEQQQFINLLRFAATEPGGKLVVVLTMRADFYDRPLQDPQLGPLFNTHAEAILPLTINELWDAIEQPARLPDVGLTFDPGLVADIVFTLREQERTLAGALPLLQFTLERLFVARAGHRLTRAAYMAIGGVQGVIGTHAEAVFAQLDESVQATLGRVFLPLVTIDEDQGNPTRRRAPLHQVATDPASEALLKALSSQDARLLQTGYDGNAAYVEVTHESLFRSWARLKDWVEEVKADVLIVRQFEREAVSWVSRGRRPEELPPHERLQILYDALVNLGKPRDSYGRDFQSYTEPEQFRLYAQLLNETPSGEVLIDTGIRLSRIGIGNAPEFHGMDLRDGVPDICWLPVDVPEEQRAKPIAFKDENGKIYGEFNLQPFHIAKHLITFVQFEAFLRAKDGFKNPKWWGDFPQEYRQQAMQSQLTALRYNPRDGVSWYQSIAFARWLNFRLQNQSVGKGDLIVGQNAEVRLPTEWEWQWAAQGGAEAYEYPFGPWQAGHANIGDVGLSRAVAVGM